MNKTIGVMIAGLGVLIGLWLGLWLMFVGGIREIVDAAQKTPVPGNNIAWGIVKIVFCELGAVPGWILILLGGWIAAGTTGEEAV